MSLTRSQIKDNLLKIGIKYDGDFNHKGWLSILCPFHPKPDKNFGNAFISENSVIKCFSCKTTSNLFKAVKKNFPTLSNSQIFNFLGDEKLSNLNRVLSERAEKQKQIETIKKAFRVNWDSLKKKDVDLELYYCKSRGFTKEWCDNFKVTYIYEGFYEGFFCIPIVFQGKNISFEFRKALEYEKLKEIYRSRGSLEELRSKFKNDNNDLTSWYSYKYLKKGKTLYPKGNIEIKDVIFNYDNLDLDQDVFICEGIAGTAQIYSSISKNVTSTFGSYVTESQIEFLRSIKGRKIIINDNDVAADTFIWGLAREVEDVYVYPEMITGAQYLLQKSGFLDDLKIT